MRKKQAKKKTIKKRVVSRQQEKRVKENNTTAIVVSRQTGMQRVSVDALAAIPEEEVWLASRKSARTRRAYRNDVAHFMKTFGIRSPEELRKIDHRAVMAWERLMREEEGIQATTVRRRLAALSSLYAHLVKFDVVEMNPVREVERPVVNGREGMTLAFSQKQARTILDTPDMDKVLGCVTAPFCLLGCKSASAARRSPALRSGTSTSIAGMMHCAWCARAARRGALPFIRRPHSASEITWQWPDIVRISKVRCFDQCGEEIAKSRRAADTCTLM